MLDQLSVVYDVLQVADQADLEEDHWINGFLTTFSIVLFGEFIQKLKINCSFQSSVKAAFGNPVSQIKGVEQLGLIVLFALQEFLLRYKKSRIVAQIIWPDLELCNSYHC